MLQKPFTFTFLIALFLSACTPAAPVATQPAALTFTDGLARTVTLAAPAQRIVSLAPSNTEILFAVGAGAQVVGRDEFSDYPAEAQSVSSVGGSMGEYSLEAIVALNPDLVLASELNAPELVKSLEDLGLTVYYLANPKTLEDLYLNLATVGALSGHSATELVATLKSRVAAVDEKIAPLSYRPIVFYEIDATDPSKPYTAGTGTFIDLLITRAGGQNLPPLAGVTDQYPQLGLEQLVLTPPDIILLGDALYGTTAETVAARPGWETLTAVINGNIFPFDDNLLSRPGPRLVDGLEALAKLLHPEAFE